MLKNVWPQNKLSLMHWEKWKHKWIQCPFHAKQNSNLIIFNAPGNFAYDLLNDSMICATMIPTVDFSMKKPGAKS